MSYSLLLLLKGPMQSWGDESRFKVRGTASTPTKSGVVGMLASAEGRRRTDSVEDLARLKFAVRVDQSGSLLRDYQTAQDWIREPGSSAKLITRYFLSDAAFVAAVESPNKDLLEGLAQALRTPKYPIFLGRRSCPAPPNLVLGILEVPAVEALQEHKTWHATPVHKKECGTTVSLPIFRDADENEEGVLRQDVPISFSSTHRRYGWRKVVQNEFVSLDNPDTKTAELDDGFMDAVINA